MDDHPRNWELHEFRVEPAKRADFLTIWHDRVRPLAEHHGPEIIGGWFVEGENRFLWLVDRGKSISDDPLAEDWVQLLAHHGHLGAERLPLGLEALTYFPRPRLDRERCVLIEIRAERGQEADDTGTLRDDCLPMMAKHGIRAAGIWRVVETERLLLLVTVDTLDQSAAWAALEADPDWARLTTCRQAIADSKRRSLLLPSDEPDPVGETTRP
ncbi:MAG: hypothetical protein U0556_02450 [Dehalococcoidia bacterium]